MLKIAAINNKISKEFEEEVVKLAKGSWTCCFAAFCSGKK
jgi:hypothetical protein